MITNSEKEWIKRNVSFGYATKEDFPSLEEGQAIPFVAVPNMRKPDGSIRYFEVEEILEALNAQPAQKGAER